MILPQRQGSRHKPNPCFDTAIYHCQQATEKEAKGFLVSRGLAFEKVHNVSLLVELATKSEHSTAPDP